MDLFVLCVACLTVFVKCLGLVDVLCWIDRVWSSKDCACDSSVHLSDFHRFCLCF